jgi:hypothetical protein
MRIAIVSAIALLFTLAIGDSASGQTSYPMITHLLPVAVQRGRAAEVTVEGQMNFTGVYKVIIEGTGIRAEIVPTPAPTTKSSDPLPIRSVKLLLTIAPNAPLGVREIRLASSLGISSIGQLLIVDDPVILEKGDNNSRDKANPITLPCVVSGQIEAVEDVDFFKFRAEAGQVLTFEVFCARLQDKIHDLQKHADPLLTLYDSQGRELAANDDFFFADPLLTFKVPRTADYFIQVRDSKYDGDRRWVYALLATNRPYVTHVYPMAANPGQHLNLELIGSAHEAKPTLPFVAPLEAGIQQIQLDINGAKTNPATFIVSALPQVLEQEPNDTPGQATRVVIPCGINGRIGKPRDLDHFVFKAGKGKPIRFEVLARRFGTPLSSSLDSVLDVLSQKGAVLATNDDSFGKDAALVFTPPADDDYVLRIRDLNSKGGATAVYYIEADFAVPDFTLRCDPDKAMIGPGSSTAWYVQVARTNGFAGPVQVEVKGLPRGVAVNPLTIPAEMTQGLLVVTAAKDAPRDAANIQVIGTAHIPQSDGKQRTLTRPAGPIEEIYAPGGGRLRYEVKMQTVAVTDTSDIQLVVVSPQTIILHPGQEAVIDVVLERRPDYKKDVTLDLLLRHLGAIYGNPLPPGVTIVEGKSKTLLGGGSKGRIVIRAAPDTGPIEHVPICVLANVSVNFVVKISYASAPIWVSIRK